MAFSQRPMSKGAWTFKNEKRESVTFDYGTEEADKADSKPVQGGFGNPSKDDTAKSSEPRSEQEPLLSAKHQLHGIVDKEGEMQFGVTTIRDGKLISLHFVGRRSLGGASGKVCRPHRTSYSVTSIYYSRQNPF